MQGCPCQHSMARIRLSVRAEFLPQYLPSNCQPILLTQPLLHKLEPLFYILFSASSLQVSSNQSCLIRSIVRARSCIGPSSRNRLAADRVASQKKARNWSCISAIYSPTGKRQSLGASLRYTKKTGRGLLRLLPDIQLLLWPERVLLHNLLKVRSRYTTRTADATLSITPPA